MLATLLLAAAAAQAVPNDYRFADNWLCRPGRADACTVDVGRSIVAADGSVRPEPATAVAAPRADCFYVYPTVSLDPTPNSDMVPGPEERGTAAAQFAPFASACRLFAPMYRQATLAALRARFTGAADAADHALAYADVRAAWFDYLAHDNNGRPVALIGHSQGSMVLKHLLAEEIDGKPVAKLLLSAILPGTSVLVPTGKVVGGDFKALPLCRAEAQTGCIVTWASYRDTAPPPANALFGRSPDPRLEAGCTNPAALGGGAAPFDAILGAPWWRAGVAQYRAPASWSAGALTTRFVRMPGLLSGACRSTGTVSYLAVHVEHGPATALRDEVAGTETVGDTAWPNWGLHVIDMAVVEGDLVRLVGAQAAAWQPVN